MQAIPIPHPVNSNGFSSTKSTQKGTFGAFPSTDLIAAREARRLKITSWDDLNLRQDFIDEEWMKNQIKAAGLRAPNQNEPATVPRLRAMLRRADVIGVEIRDSVGTNLEGYLKLNPLLPLWAALAQVLEATGRFIRTAPLQLINSRTPVNKQRTHP